MFWITKKKHEKIINTINTALQVVIKTNAEDFNKIEGILVAFAQYKMGGGKKYMSAKSALRGIVQIIDERKKREDN